jgi:hypothetical protein
LQKLGIIRRIEHKDIKAVSLVTLPQKPHAGDGLPVKELLHQINNECIHYRLPAAKDLPKRPQPVSADPTLASETKAKKYWFCCDFNEVNQKARVPPFMSGNIKLKQQQLAGHRYMCKFDFATGFYALSVDGSSQLYLAFFVPDHLFFTWQRMLFGITGAPTVFGCIAAEALDGLVGRIMELFANDRGAADDNFDSLFQKITTIFDHARERKLSISPQKLAFFVSQMIFAGGVVSSTGLTADPAKVAAVVDWEQLQTVHNLMGFLRTTGYFCSLIQDYSRIAKPLSDLC